MLTMTLLIFFGCSSSEEAPNQDVVKTGSTTEASTQPTINPKAEQLQKQASAILGPLPDKMPGSENDTPEKVALGKKLYFEKALSINDSQSCNSCQAGRYSSKSGTVQCSYCSAGQYQASTGQRSCSSCRTYLPPF